MTELSPEGRALLRGLREDIEPSFDDRDRVGRALATRLGIAAGTIGATTATSAIASGAAAAGTGATSLAAGAGSGLVGGTFLLGAKWLGLTLLVAAAGAGGVSAYRGALRRSDAPSTTASLPLARAPGAPSPFSSLQGAAGTSLGRPGEPLAASDAVEGPSSGTDPPTIAPRSAGSAPAPSQPARTHESVASPQGPENAAAPLAPAAPADGVEGTLGQETRLLRRADEELQSGNPARALDLLDEHARTFPRGVLAEERSAERITTLCKLGRSDEAHAEAQHFLATTPDSPLAQIVRSSCGATDNRAGGAPLP